MSHSLLPTGNILWAYEGKLSFGLELPSRWGNARGRRMSFFYKPTASPREIICVGSIAVCSVFRNPSVTLTQVTQSAFFPFLEFFISAKRTLVCRLRGAWWLALYRDCFGLLFYCCWISNSLFMGILYFGRLRLLRSSNVEENHGLRA